MEAQSCICKQPENNRSQVHFGTQLEDRYHFDGSGLCYKCGKNLSSGLSRRHFLKLAMMGTAGIYLPSASDLSRVPNNLYYTPEVVRTSPQNEANAVRLSNGSLFIFYMERNSHVESIRSEDHGLTWSKPKVEFSVSGDTAYACRSLLDQNGEVHIWYLKRGGENSSYPGNRHFDIWHIKTVDNRKSWVEPGIVWNGYCGAIRGALQMDNGRIVVPFGAWKTGKENLPEDTGSNYTTVIYSDDNGTTWQQSPVALTSPVFKGYNGNNYGACEPCITQLSDGRLWILIRTQTGVLYESFSQDGINWTDAVPTRFTTSNSPAAFTQIDDKRIMVLWNNHELPPRVNGDGVYGGRDALHAAISEDDGQTWRGFREVYLDPTRNDTPPVSGDRGTAYPNSVATADGYTVVITGQAPHARAIVRFHPDWLYETHRRHDFTSEGLKNWSVYKSFGPATRWWRDRMPGARLADHPDKTAQQVLHVRRPDEHDPDGATWNFPAGGRGTLSLRIRVNRGNAGAQISLADRLFDPTDDQGKHQSIFMLIIDSYGQIDRNTKLVSSNWHTLNLNWDIEKESCQLVLDGQITTNLGMENSTENGISYIRIRSIADKIDNAGIFIESVEVNVEYP